MDNIDTRKHFAVPMTVTVKVENAEQAVELVSAIAQSMTSIKGISIKHPPVVGVAQELGSVSLSQQEQDAASELGAMLDGLGIDAPSSESPTSSENIGNHPITCPCPGCAEMRKIMGMG
jgi:hypothetical protein